MITHNELWQKFEDKGFQLYEMFLLVGVPPIIIYDPTSPLSVEEFAERQRKIQQEVYGSEWEYWNTWIDYQKHK
jgi:hypothetical protein